VKSLVTRHVRTVTQKTKAKVGQVLYRESQKVNFRNQRGEVTMKKRMRKKIMRKVLILLMQVLLAGALNFERRATEVCGELGVLEPILDEPLMTSVKVPLPYESLGLLKEVEEAKSGMKLAEEFTTKWLEDTRLINKNAQFKGKADGIHFPSGALIVKESTPATRYADCANSGGILIHPESLSEVEAVIQTLRAYNITKTFMAVKLDKTKKILLTKDNDKPLGFLAGITSEIASKLTDKSALALEIKEKDQPPNWTVVEEGTRIKTLCSVTQGGPLISDRTEDDMEKVIAKTRSMTRSLEKWIGGFKNIFGVTGKVDGNKVMRFRSYWRKQLESFTREIKNNSWRKSLEYPGDIVVVKKYVELVRKYLMTNRLTAGGLVSKMIKPRLKELLPNLNMEISGGLVEMEPVQKRGLPYAPGRQLRRQSMTPQEQIGEHVGHPSANLLSLKAAMGLRVKAYQLEKYLTSSMRIFRFDYMVDLAGSILFTNDSPKDFIKCEDGNEANERVDPICRVTHNPESSDYGRCRRAFFQKDVENEEIVRCTMPVEANYLQTFRRSCGGRPEELCITSAVEGFKLTLECLHETKFLQLPRAGSYCLNSCAIHFENANAAPGEEHKMIRSFEASQLKEVTVKHGFLQDLRSSLEDHQIQTSHLFLAGSTLVVSLISWTIAVMTCIYINRQRQRSGGQSSCWWSSCRKGGKEARAKKGQKKKSTRGIEEDPEEVEMAAFLEIRKDEERREDEKAVIIQSTQQRPLYFVQDNELTPVPEQTHLRLTYGKKPAVTYRNDTFDRPMPSTSKI